MFIFLTVVVGLALYGAFALFGSITGSTSSAAHEPIEVETVATATDVGFKQRLADSALSMAMSSVGLDTVPLIGDTPGCSSSILSPTQVEDLVLSLPEPQRTALAKVMVASSAVWTAQLYSGPKGMGMCLPNQGKLLVFRGLQSPLTQ